MHIPFDVDEFRNLRDGRDTPDRAWSKKDDVVDSQFCFLHPFSDMDDEEWNWLLMAGARSGSRFLSFAVRHSFCDLEEVKRWWEFHFETFLRPLCNAGCIGTMTGSVASRYATFFIPLYHPSELSEKNQPRPVSSEEAQETLQAFGYTQE